VVTGIVLLVAGMAVPMLAPYFAGGSVRDATDIFQQACVQARSRAVQESVSFRVIVISRTSVQSSKPEQSVQVSVDSTVLSGLTGEDKNRMIGRKIHLPRNTRFLGLSSQSVEYVFTSTGAIDRSATTGALSGFSIIDLKQEHGRDIELFSSTGQVLSTEKAF